MRWSLSIASAASAALFVLPALAAITPEMTMDERYLVRRSLNKGMGTRYGLDCTEEDCWQNGACAFTDYTLPSSVDGSTCVSEELWDSSAHCGGCISVSYKGKTITVMVSRSSGPRSVIFPLSSPYIANEHLTRSPTKPAATRTTST
jgi:hypothetical protein